jgi:hypothetical protein
MEVATCFLQDIHSTMFVIIGDDFAVCICKTLASFWFQPQNYLIFILNFLPLVTCFTQIYIIWHIYTKYGIQPMWSTLDNVEKRDLFIYRTGFHWYSDVSVYYMLQAICKCQIAWDDISVRNWWRSKDYRCNYSLGDRSDNGWSEVVRLYTEIFVTLFQLYSLHV